SRDWSSDVCSSDLFGGGAGACEGFEDGAAGWCDESDEPAHEVEGLDGGVCNLPVSWSLGGGCLGLVAEHGEEPGRAALVAVTIGRRRPPLVRKRADRVAPLRSGDAADRWRLAEAALPVELGGLGVVEDDVRRPATGTVGRAILPRLLRVVSPSARVSLASPLGS